MKNKIIKFFAWVLILEIVIEPFSVKKVKAATDVDKGDLRCPSNSNDKCKEYKDSSGKVIATEVVENDGTIKLIKTVTKISEGTYDVYFRIEGQASKSIFPEAYVVLVMDTSGSMQDDNSLNEAKAAVKQFSKKLAESKYPVNIAMVQFASNAITIRGFDKKEISSDDMCYYNNGYNNNGRKTKNFSKKYKKKCDSIGKGSVIATGMERARSLLASLSDDKLKYIVVFGDGDYITKNNWINMTTVKNNLNKIKNLHYFGLRFPSAYYENTGENKALASSNLDMLHSEVYDKKKSSGICKDEITGKGPYVMTNCYVKLMKNIMNPDGNNLKEGNSNQWSDILSSIADNIEDQHAKSETYSGKLIDNLGNAFTLHGTDGKKIEINVKDLPYVSEHYTINIDSTVKDGWYPTNNGIKFEYDNKKIESKINPEVYWIQEIKEFHDCHSNISFTEKYTNNKGIINDFEIENDSIKSLEIKKIHTQSCVEKINAELNINNQNVNINNFSILSGLGVPISLTLNSNITCTNSYDANMYNSLSSKYNNTINKTSNQRLKRYINSYITALSDIQKNVSDINIQSELNNYVNEFKNQSAQLNINYNDGSKINSMREFVTTSFNSSGVICDTETCSVNLSKKLEVKPYCIELMTNNVVDCQEDSNNQILGGNKYYLNQDVISGTISVQVLNTGYNGNISITMKDTGDKSCQYDTFKKENLMYRQIDVRDPFVQTFNQIDKRNIGKNFYNNNYNFVNIIDSDIWNKEYKYLYKISKTNVNNIKNSTIGSNEKVNSYLGTNCYVKKETNEYICPFIRNNSGTNGNNQDYFSDYIIK